VLKISLRPSRVLAAILIVAHGAAIAAVVAVDMPLWLKLIAAAALILSLFLTVRREALLLTPDAAVALEISADDVLSIQTRRGEWLECEVLGSTYVMSFLSILNLRQTDGGATTRIVILPDSIAAEDFRKLRVWLRWGRARGPAVL
jgi:toxin CptA